MDNIKIIIKIYLILFACMLTMIEAKSQRFFIGDDSGRTNILPTTDMAVDPLVSNGYDGSPYLEDDWNLGKIVFQDDFEIESIPIKYNIVNQELEVQHENQIKTSPYYLISSFEWVNIENNTSQQFINAKNLSSQLNNIPLTKFLEVLVDDKCKLYCKHEYQIEQADYIPALNVGSINPKINHLKVFYIEINEELFEVKGKKKKILKIFGEKETEIKQFVNDNYLKFKKREHLIEIVQYYNSLLN